MFFSIFCRLSFFGAGAGIFSGTADCGFAVWGEICTDGAVITGAEDCRVLYGKGLFSAAGALARVSVPEKEEWGKGAAFSACGWGR